MSGGISRFTLAERLVHWSVAVLMAVCILTALALYNRSLALAVGHRHLVSTLHVWSGYALPVPMLLGVLSVAYRGDLRRLNRFTGADREWLRRKDRRVGAVGVGKFNAGQKLNAALTAAATTVLLGTGLLMHVSGLVRLSWRTGATLVHDWTALALGLLVLGHLVYALRDTEALRGMWTGRVSPAWARREHPEWAEESRNG